MSSRYDTSKIVQPEERTLQPYPPATTFTCRIAVCILIVIVCCAPVLIIRHCTDSVCRLSYQEDKFDMGRFVKIEGLSPDERDLFDGFQTSYIPLEDVSAMRDRRSIDQFGNVIDENLTADQFLWGDVDGDATSYPTVYRKKRLAVMALGTLSDTKFGQLDYPFENPFDVPRESDISDEASTSKNQISDDDFDNMNPQDHHIDRGPFDDLVEQVRRQPELEEGEMASAAHLYKIKNTKSFTMIHSFWKGQGDRTTIRNTQANIMRQYMDSEADPCEDFYQYACGNWAPLNPIPPDKAGYDTFEMLRENLDAVLKDLLEFKKNERVKEKYPGPHLDLRGNFLNPADQLKEMFKDYIDMDLADLDEIDKITDMALDKTGKENKTEILERLRRYLDKKSKRLHIPFRNKIKSALKRIKLRKGKTVRGEIITLIKKRSFMTKSIAATNKPDVITKPASRKPFIAIDVKTTNYTAGIDKTEKNKIYKPFIFWQLGKKNATVKNKTSSRIKRTIKADEDFLEKLGSSEKPKNLEPEDPANGDAALKSRFLFKSCMNYAILEKRGHQPLLDLLNLLGGWPILDPKWDGKNFNWLELMAKLRLFNNDILISEWVGPDIKNSDEFVIQFDQTSLGLPTRDYFLQKSNKIYLEAYKQYLITIGILLGGNKGYVKKSADELIEFEIKLAKITSAPEDRRNVSELYRRMPLRNLEELVPEVRWRRYLCVVMNRTVRSDEVVVLFALSYVRHLVTLVHQTPPKTLSNYLLWRFVRHRVNNLDDRFQSAKQQFYFVLFGREEAPPRWKNCISQVNSNMGMALGSMFVRKYFDETSKNDTMTMTREIQQSFRELLHLTNWIDDSTKKLAAKKVDAMMLRIGYPDFILNKKELDDRYKEVKIHPDKYFENILNILQHLTKMEQGRLGQPVNKTLWNTAPAVVNAYYSRNKNQIMFPAGILQPPFYHRHFPRSLNYGGIGVVIGHEITHGFDDKGRLFDCDGNLHRWWSDTAIEAFHRRAQCLIDQYGRYVVPEVNMKLNGVNTQGENIADNGGVKQAFRAYLRWLKRNGPEGETLPGLNHTHTQLFFLNFAQVWCGAMRPEAMRNKLKTAVHSPGRFRVIGTLSNSHDFAREFRCPPGSPMNPISKCTVW